MLKCRIGWQRCQTMKCTGAITNILPVYAELQPTHAYRPSKMIGQHKKNKITIYLILNCKTDPQGSVDNRQISPDAANDRSDKTFRSRGTRNTKR